MAAIHRQGQRQGFRPGLDRLTQAQCQPLLNQAGEAGVLARREGLGLGQQVVDEVERDAHQPTAMLIPPRYPGVEGFSQASPSSCSSGSLVTESSIRLAVNTSTRSTTQSPGLRRWGSRS